MLTQEKTRADAPIIPDGIETVEYPPEVVERWDKIFEITKLQFATGEIQPITGAGLAAKYGIDIDDD